MTDDDDSIQADLAEIREELRSLSEIREQLRFLNGFITAGLASVQETVRSEVTEARVVIMARIDRLSDIVTGVRDDIRVNFGASETVRRANEHTREELRDTQNMIADMRRQLLSMGERLAHLEQKPPAP